MNKIIINLIYEFKGVQGAQGAQGVQGTQGTQGHTNFAA